MQGQISVSEVKGRLNTDFYYGSNIAMEMTYDVTCTYMAALSTLNTILYGPAVPERYKINENESFDDMFYDDEVSWIWGDFASETVKAYSCIDNSIPTKWHVHNNVSFDANKRLEFWEWWLTEAIPQAWKLAEQSQ